MTKTKALMQRNLARRKSWASDELKSRETACLECSEKIYSFEKRYELVKKLEPSVYAIKPHNTVPDRSNPPKSHGTSFDTLTKSVYSQEIF